MPFGEPIVSTPIPARSAVQQVESSYALDLPPEGTEAERTGRSESFPALCDQDVPYYRGQLGSSIGIANALYQADQPRHERAAHGRRSAITVDPAQARGRSARKVDIRAGIGAVGACDAHRAGRSRTPCRIEAIGPGRRPSRMHYCWSRRGSAEDRARRAVSRAVRGRAGHPRRRHALGNHARHVAADGSKRGERARAVTLTP